MKKLNLFYNLILLISIFFITQTASAQYNTNPSPEDKQSQLPSRTNQPSDIRPINISHDPVNRNLIPKADLIYIDELYRRTKKEELKAIAPNEADTRGYADFLKQPNTGLIRLVSDAGCDDNKNVIVVSPECLKYKFPGFGSSYSFRIKDYRMQRLADISFIDNTFVTPGFLVQSIMVGIGDVPLEKTTPETKGIKFLTDFQPLNDLKSVSADEQKFRNGISRDGFFYSRQLKAIENMTYVLRSMAYAGKSIRTIQGVVFDEFEFDKREDVTVAFRIVRKDQDGSITILWKELAGKNSPKIKAYIRQVDKSGKENNFTARK